MAHCKTAHICLVGANRFQNELFAANLMQLHNCQNNYVHASTLHDIPELILNQTTRKVFCFFDSFGQEPRELLYLLDAAYQFLPGRHLSALFNLDPGSGIEKEAMNYGVRGFFSPNDKPDDFCKGIRAMLRGEVWISRQMASAVLLAGLQPPGHHAPAESAHLSDREKEVLMHLVSGATNETIATELYVSVHTLRTHLYHIYRKINVHNRTQAARWAEKNL